MGRDRTKRDTETGDADIERAILLAATAGACRLWAREDPTVASGMTKAAESYGAQAADILTKWAEGQ